jgi:ubiquinone/menaquinone biosynthesis C-methylase UbiE
MGIYRRQVLPRLQDRFMRGETTDEIRARVCSGLTGSVLEIGFGTGLNVRHYPEAVDEIVAVEPSELCMELAAPRIAKGDTPVRRGGLTGEVLDLPTASADSALSTWTLCTIPDLAAALAEVRRVLKPGGTFHFVEHGHSPDPGVARWQRRIEPVNRRLAGGCHLTRDIPLALVHAGFEIEAIDTYYSQAEPKPMGYTFEGRAVSP